MAVWSHTFIGSQTVWRPCSYLARFSDQNQEHNHIFDVSSDQQNKDCSVFPWRALDRTLPSMNIPNEDRGTLFVQTKTSHQCHQATNRSLHCFPEARPGFRPPPWRSLSSALPRSSSRFKFYQVKRNKLGRGSGKKGLWENSAPRLVTVTRGPKGVLTRDPEDPLVVKPVVSGFIHFPLQLWLEKRKPRGFQVLVTPLLSCKCEFNWAKFLAVSRSG